MSSCNQTPVALLQELCVQRCWNPPQYDLTLASGTANNPIFEITVVLSSTGVKGVGRGRQKKEAKHEAAKDALSRINRKAVTDGRTLVQEPALADRLINPHKDAGAVNAVGELQELCQIKKLPSPVYTEVGNEGEPHAKTFTMRCTVSTRHATGTASKKQLAKHYAAAAMLQTFKTNLSGFLKEIPDDISVGARAVCPDDHEENNNAATEENQKTEEIVQKYEKLKSDLKIISIANPGMCIGNEHLEYRKYLEELSNILKEPEFPNRDPIKQLNYVAIKLQRKVDTVLSELDKRPFAYKIMEFPPAAVQSAFGNTLDEAESNAAKKLIEFLKVMAM